MQQLETYCNMVNKDFIETKNIVNEYLGIASKMVGNSVMQNDINFNKENKMLLENNYVDNIDITTKFQKKPAFYKSIEENDQGFAQFFGFTPVNSVNNTRTYDSVMTEYCKQYLNTAAKVLFFCVFFLCFFVVCKVFFCFFVFKLFFVKPYMQHNLSEETM